MKSLNRACLFAYEIHLITATKQEDDPKSLLDIQRSAAQRPTLKG